MGDQFLFPAGAVCHSPDLRLWFDQAVGTGAAESVALSCVALLSQDNRGHVWSGLGASPLELGLRTQVRRWVQSVVQMKFCSGVITCQAEAGAAALGVTSQGSSGVRVGSAPRAGSRLWPPSLGALPSELCPLTGLTPPVPPCRGRNAAGRDGRERLGGSVLEQIPFLQSCEDEDSDEDDELDSVQHKKQRVKVRCEQSKCSSPPLLSSQRTHLLCAPAGAGGLPLVCVWPEHILESPSPCLSSLQRRLGLYCEGPPLYPCAPVLSVLPASAQVLLRGHS